MKIIEPSYEILTPIDGTQALKTIEYCARTCYQSYDKQTDDSCFQFVKMLMGRNHESCLEHYSFSVKFIVDFVSLITIMFKLYDFYFLKWSK